MIGAQAEGEALAVLDAVEAGVDLFVEGLLRFGRVRGSRRHD